MPFPSKLHTAEVAEIERPAVEAGLPAPLDLFDQEVEYRDAQLQEVQYRRTGAERLLGVLEQEPPALAGIRAFGSWAGERQTVWGN